VSIPVSLFAPNERGGVTNHVGLIAAAGIVRAARYIPAGQKHLAALRDDDESYFVCGRLALYAASNKS